MVSITRHSMRSNLLTIFLMPTALPLLICNAHFCNPLGPTTALLVPGRFPTDQYGKFLN